MGEGQLPETVGAALGDARGIYSTGGTRLTPATAQALLAYVVGQNRAWVLTHPEALLTHEQSARYMALLLHAASGTPLPYLIGEQEFYGMWFRVSPEVLIPRPETESLVGIVLDWVKQRSTTSPRIVDIGTGSGIIAITLAAKLPDAQVSATDVSEEALAIARENAIRHGVQDRVHVQYGDIFEGINDSFDVIAANLPYINQEELTALEVGRWEPRVALDGGADGLSLIRRLLRESPPRLHQPGLLALEIGYDQGERALALCREAFPGADVTLHADLAGLDRIVRVELA
nr:peptide chain release factor N(5)-glutamine methyltransferase [Anaerolineae bacterium]